MSRAQSFFWGMIGSLLPEALRFFKIVAAGQALPAIRWDLYVGLLVVYCVLAGLLSIAWKPEAEFKALWVGASLPSIVATLIQAAPNPPH
jgi:hypothetical protein